MHTVPWKKSRTCMHIRTQENPDIFICYTLYHIENKIVIGSQNGLQKSFNGLLT